MNPYDWNALRNSEKTTRVIVAHEDTMSGVTAPRSPLASANELFECPRRTGSRVAAMDTFVAYAPQLEEAILPQVADVLKAIVELNVIRGFDS